MVKGGKDYAAEAGFKQGLNCSQALLSAFSEDLGLDRATALKVASAFGGGMGLSAGTCGAVTGALMALGLKYGGAKRPQDSYRAARELMERFKSRNGSVLCKELLGCDIGTDEGMRAASEKKVFTSLCPRFVKEAAAMVEEMIVKDR